MDAYTPVKEKTRYDADQLLSAAEQSMRDLGYRTVKLDRSSHRVSTREKEVGYSSVPRLSYKYSFQVETTGGQLVIEADCKMNSAMSREKFSDCGDERPDRVLDELAALRKAILEEAKRTPPPPKFFQEPAVEEESPADDGSKQDPEASGDEAATAPR